MLHFASYFLAQQLICCVHVFSYKNAPFVPGECEGAAGGEPCHPEPQRRVFLAGHRDASLRLSMTDLPLVQIPGSICAFALSALR